MPSLADYIYELPDELIAQRPLPSRDESRLLVVDRATGKLQHARFRSLPRLLRCGDLLVGNDTRVVPARVRARKKATGGRVELLFHGLPTQDARGGWTCRCLTRSSKRLRPGTALRVIGRAGESMAGTLTVADVLDGGEAVIACPAPGPPFPELLGAAGEVPLPPYIRRGDDGPDDRDAVRYQTVYAREPGAVAAPTAGLHFTPALLTELADGGVEQTQVTLHVGPGTFLPVRDDDYAQHRMLPERYRVTAEAAQAIAAHHPPTGRVVAVGTTSVRALEWAGRTGGPVCAGDGETPLFITPGYEFRVIDALITNFHLPGSTLLLLVCAFAGRDLILRAYREAVRERYRFYSYGDAMLIV